MKTLLLISFNCIVAISCFSQAAVIDKTFGFAGRVVTKFESSVIIAQAVATQNDGKIVVVGGRPDYANGFAIARYFANGDLDSSFARNGKKYNDINSYDRSSSAYAVALQADGKILVAGYAEKSGNYNRDFILIRYNNDGTRDSLFGINGVTGTDFSQWDEARSMAIQPDGKIVLAGFCTFSNRAFALARYNADGSVDTAFGINGKATTSILVGQYANSVALQADRKIIVSGEAGATAVTARFNENGTLDRSFAKAGSVTTPGLYCHAMAIQVDGKIVLGGQTSTRPDAILVRYKRNGGLDSSFGKDGFVIRKNRSSQNINALCMQSDNKILAAGSDFTSDVTKDDFLLLRYTESGKPDSTFGRNGEAQPVDFNELWDRAYGLALARENKIVVVGSATTDYIYGTSPGVRFGVVCFKAETNIEDASGHVAPSTQFNNNVSILLYPNPVRDVLKITGLDQFTNYDLRITNLKGVVVARTSVSNTSSYEWNLESVSKGLYYLAVSSNNNKTIMKFLKE